MTGRGDRDDDTAGLGGRTGAGGARGDRPGARGERRDRAGGLTPGLVAALCALPLAAIVALRRTFDPDLPWHLATGRLALALRSSLPVDPFSFSAAGAPWPYKDLVADVILYAGFARLGHAWLALLKGAAALAIAAALWLALPPGRRRPLPWLAGLAVYLLAIQYRVTERPLLSLGAYPLLLALCERARRQLADGGGAARALAPPVLLLWAWAQLHREAMVGLVTLAGLGPALLLGHLLRGTRLRPLLRPAPPRAAALAALAAALAALLVLVNPSGAAFYETTLALARSAALQDLLYEWKALPLPELWRLFPATVAACAAGLGAALLRLGLALRRGEDGPVDLWHLGLFGLFAARAAGSIRWLPFLAAIACLALLLCLADAADRLRPRPGAGRPPRGLPLLLLVCAGAALATLSPYAVGVGPVPDHYPDGALAFARGRGLRARVANAFGLGGSVIWRGAPALQVLVDGRTDMIYPPDFVAACARAQRDGAAFREMRAKDGADWVLAVNRPGQETHLFLAGDPAWPLVYLDEAAAVYVRADAYPALLPLRFRHLRPGALVGSLLEALAAAGGEPRALSEIEDEVRRLLAASPDGVRAGAAAALLHHHLGRPAERDRALRHLLRLHPDHPGTREVLRRVGRAADGTKGGPEPVGAGPMTERSATRCR